MKTTTMKKNMTRILSFLLMLLLIASIPMNSFAASGTMKIKCNASKIYYYSSPGNNGGFTIGGHVEIKKGGVVLPDRVILRFRPCTEDPGTKRVARLTIKTSDNVSHTIIETRQKLSGGRVRITDVKDGKTTYDKTFSGTQAATKYACTITLEASGTLWKALKSVYATVSETGMCHGDLSYTVTT